VPWHFLDFLWPKIALAHQGILLKDIDKKTIKGPFFSENLMGLKKICQITILNLNF
jgi:hypothetical protein